MEKYRKFEDPQHGVNPFVPDKLLPRSGVVSKGLYILQLISGLIKFPLFIFMYVNFICSHILKYLVIVPSIIRFVEIAINKSFGFFFLSLLGVYQFNYKFKKWNNNSSPNIIISNQSSIIEWLSLMYLYSPKFLWTAKSSDHTSDHFFELNCFNVLFYGIGLKFISASDRKQPFNLEEYLKSGAKTPVVIFPENTKTNKKGALSVRSNTMSNLYSLLADKPNLIVRVDNFTSKFKYFSPYNTVESSGLVKLFYTLSQLYNNIEIYSQDLNSMNFDRSVKFSIDKFKNIDEFFDSQIQSYIVQPENRYCLSLNCYDHIEFLQYYHSTQNNISYVKKND